METQTFKYCESRLCAWEPLDHINQPVAFIFPRLDLSEIVSLPTWGNHPDVVRETFMWKTEPWCRVHWTPWREIQMKCSLEGAAEESIQHLNKASYRSLRHIVFQLIFRGQRWFRVLPNTDLCVSGGFFFWRRGWGFTSLSSSLKQQHTQVQIKNTLRMCVCMWFLTPGCNSSASGQILRFFFFFLHNKENHLSAIKKKTPPVFHHF